MPASSSAIPDGPPFRSASTIVAAGEVSGYHLLKVVGYSRTKMVPNGKSINSRTFRVGSRSWRVQYFPNGRCSDDAESISLFLSLDDAVAEPVEAQAEFTLLEQDGEQVYGFIDREELEESDYLRDDSFTVRVDVTIMDEFYSEDTPLEPAPFVLVPPSDMHRHFGDLLSRKEGADVRFRVGRKKFAAHRWVLAARSPVFRAQLYGLMRESKTTDVIQIDDMEEQVFSTLLTFMYTDELPDMKQEEESAIAQHLLVAADRYAMERLKLICEDKLCKHIYMGSVATVLALADQHHCRGLKEACFAFLSSPATLDDFMESEGFEYLEKSCPSVVKELRSKALPP